MPIYEYLCQSCGEKEERLEGFDAPTEHDCPKCGTGSAMHREISLTSFTLAGGGWHAQGYANGSSGRKAGGGSTTPAKADEGPATPATPAKPEGASGGGCAGGCACHPAKNQ
jgi:putative FmdB family regulatory protein